MRALLVGRRLIFRSPVSLTSKDLVDKTQQVPSLPSRSSSLVASSPFHKTFTSSAAASFLKSRTSALKSFRVLVTDPVDKAGISALQDVAEVDVRTKLSADELCEIIGDYDALVFRTATQVTDRVLENGRRLKIIGRVGVGLDNVDVDAATRRGIFVVNSPHGNTTSTAEYSLAMLFSVARKIPAADAAMRAGEWNKEKFFGVELKHKTLGIVGFGEIGQQVGKVCHELGMDLMCYDPYVDRAKAEALGCRIAPKLEDLLSEADIVTLHVPLIPSTKNLINEERIRQMKSTALLVNCSRGGVVNERDLCKALHEGRLGGAALDVFDIEGKIDKDSPFMSVPNLVLTPHMGSATHEAEVNVAVDVAEKIRSTLQGSLPGSAVNLPGLRSVGFDRMQM